MTTLNKQQLRLGAGTVALALSLAATPAFAQVETEDQGDKLIVTGTRIQGVEQNGPSPVQVFDAEEIQATGASTLQEFMFESNLAGPGIFSESATLSQSSGAAFFDGRGFGTGYTLILLNGRRLPATPITGEQGTDLNMLPIAAVERVEYLSDGASAIYGSDAIAGVINILTRTDYDGVSLTGRVGIADDGEGFQYRASGVWGTSNENGSVLLSAEVFHQNAIDAADRPLVRSAFGPPDVVNQDGLSPIGDIPAYVNADFTLAEPGAGCPAERIRPSSFAASGTECSFDFAPLYQVNPDTTRIVSSAFAEYDVADGLNLFLDVRYARTETEVRNGASPAFFLIPAGEQGNPYPEAAYALRRIVDAGPRARDATNQTFAVAGGFNYDIGAGHSVEGYVQSSWVSQNQLGVSGQIVRDKLEAAVADGSFSLTELNGPDVIDAISAKTFREGDLQERVFSLGLTGPLIEGDFEVSYYVGGEIRTETYSDFADDLSKQGQILGGASSDGEGDRKQKAVYAELSISPMDIIDISLAGRFDDVQAGGQKLGDEFTYKAAVSINPVDILTIRGSYGTGFKAPALGELFLGRSFGVTRAVDTTVCNNVTNTPGATQAEIDAACRTREIRSISGGNPNLEPETSKSINFGVILEPTPDLRFSADYWNIEVEGKIGSLTVQEILNNEDLYPDLVNRVGGQLSDPNNSFVRSDLQNLTVEEGEGIDFVLSFNPAVGDGELLLDLRASYLISFLRQSSAIQPLCEDAGTTSEPEWRGNGRLGWRQGMFKANVTARYVGKTEDRIGGLTGGTCDPAGVVDPVDDYLEFGANVTVDLTPTMNVTVGVNNLFEEIPPATEIAAGGWPYYDQALYTNFGRYFYMSAGIEF